MEGFIISKPSDQPAKATALVRAVLLCGILHLPLLGHASSGTVRGVVPQLREVYRPGPDGTWACLGGGPVLEFGRVNDNYCDCIDGSDEPGTAACPNGKFYCRNRGHEPLLLNSSLVDDGICDCCDGTDEPPGRCPNTCAEAGAASRQGLRALVAAAEAGAQKRAAYIEQARASLQSWREQLQQLVTEEATLVRTVAEWQKKSARAAQIDARIEAARKRAAPPPPAEPSVEKPESEPDQATEPAPDGHAPEAQSLAPDSVPDGEAAQASGSADGEPVQAVPAPEPDQATPAPAPDQATQKKMLDPEEMARQLEAAEAAAAAAVPRDGGEEEGAPSSVGHSEQAVHHQQQHEDTPEEIGKRIASQWTHDPEAVGRVQADEEEAEEEAAEEVIEGHEVMEEEALEAAEEEEEEEVSQEDLSDVVLEPLGFLQRAKLSLYKALGWQAQLDLEEQNVRKSVKAEYHRQENRLSTLRNDKKALEQKLEHDFGPEGEFIVLLGKCFSTLVEKYTYEVCPYASAYQKEGSSSTSLGTWSGFKNNYTALAFTNGQHCWNGPHRSIQVGLVCGQEEVLRAVTEPNRCEYQAELVTPAACLPAFVESVAQHLAQAEAEVAGHDEL